MVKQKHYLFLPMFFYIAVLLIPTTAIKGASTLKISVGINTLQDNIFIKTSNFPKKKKRKKRIGQLTKILIGIGVVSLGILLLAGLGAGLTILELSGFLFFTLGTGVGFILSKGKDGGKKNKFANALYILAIITNVVAAGFILLFFNGFD